METWNSWLAGSWPVSGHSFSLLKLRAGTMSPRFPFIFKTSLKSLYAASDHRFGA
jgi:hypothetical protein